MRRIIFRDCLFALALLGLLAGPSLAETDEGEVYDVEAVEAYEATMHRMHEAMAGVTYSGDADIDFARGMIPHHVAAIEMAEIVLEHGTDPEIRALAEAVIAAQADEIEMLENWLAANDPAAGDPAVGQGHGHGHDEDHEHD